MSLLIKGVTKLSELEIDAAKDWQGKGISNIGTVVVTDGAGHYIELPSLTTAQRDALTPSSGMTIWNSDNARVEKYNGAAWGAIGISGVTVRKNTRMPVVGSRPQLNFMEGAAIGISIADNPPDDEIDIAISAKYPTQYFILIPDDASLAVPAGETKAAIADVVGTNFGYKTLDYNKDAEETAHWGYWLTPDYQEENIIVDIFWISTGAGNCKWGVQVLGRGDGEAYDAALGTERTVVSATGGAGVLNRSRIATFSPNWAAQDVVRVRLARKATDGADTLDADARVVKVKVSYTGQFAQAFYPFPQATSDVGVGKGTGSWVDVDASLWGVPIGATGIIVHVNNTGGISDFGLRKKGMTFDTTYKRIIGHTWFLCGIDENRIFQIYKQADSIQFLLVGYTATGVVFLDTAVTKKNTVDNTWQDIDVSVECPAAVAVIFEVENRDISAEKAVRVRKKGSTDDVNINARLMSKYHTQQIVPLDASQVFQAYNSDFADIYYHILGYITEGVSMRTNVLSKAITPASVWVDLDCSVEAPSAVMLFFTLTPAYTSDYGMRKEGDTENIVRAEIFGMVIVPCDAYQRVEGQYTGGVPYDDLQLTGYAQWAGA